MKLCIALLLVAVCALLVLNLQQGSERGGADSGHLSSSSLQQSTSPANTDSPVRSAALPLDAPAADGQSKEESDGQPDDPELLRKLRIARARGLVGKDDGPRSEAAWAAFAEAWDRTTPAVNVAAESRKKIGARIAKALVREGKCETLLLDEKDRGPDGGYTGKWAQPTHPAEYLLTQYDARPGGGQIVRQVRIMPGQYRELDDASNALELAESTRRDAITRAIRQPR